MTARQWILAGLALVGILGGSIFIWELGRARAVHVDNGGPLSWSFAGSAFPLGFVMYVLTRRLYHRRPILLAGIVSLTLIATACAATGIALATGVIVGRNAMGFPFLGVWFGWHAGGAMHQLFKRRPSSPRG